MRIVVSGTHASGKSTVIGDFASRNPEYRVLADPYEDLLDDEFDGVDARLFGAQLGVAARRLVGLTAEDDVIAERGPLDFLAYLLALDRLGRPGRSRSGLEAAVDRTQEAAAHIDLLVLVPLDASIRVPGDEDPELREEMDSVLLELADDPDLTGRHVIEVGGRPSARLTQLQEAIEAHRASS